MKQSTTQNSKNIAIIGSGFGGLSAACYLAQAGHKVTVYEKNEQLGGRASVKRADWFTRDMGPSRYLMPDLFEEFFSDFGKDISDYLSLTKLDPSYKVYFKDDLKHPMIDVSSDIEKNRETFESLEPGSTDTLHTYLQSAKIQYDIGINWFVKKNYNSIFDFINLETLINAFKLKITTNIGKYVKRYFASDYMQKIMQYPMIFLWSPLYQTPAMYNLMTYVDFGMWVWYPQWGMWSLVQALVQLGTELWVEYRTDSEVTKIHTTPVEYKWRTLWKNKTSKVTALELQSGEIVQVDHIVSNADMHWTETQLLDTADQTYDEAYRDKHVLAPSGFCIYLGLDRKVDWLDHHTLIFNQDREKSNKEIFGSAEYPSDPSYYICCPSKSDPNVAPEWSENLFVLVPFPSRVTMDDDAKQAYADKILTDAERILGQDLRSHIVYQEIFWPDEFTSRYHAYGGNALSGWAHLFRQTAIFRPTNVSKKVEWLFYAWGYTNPGIWVPICIISGKLASERVGENMI